MSTTRKIASGSALRMTVTVSTAVVSFLIMPFIVHRLGDRLYGIWTLVATFIGYYGVLELGLSRAVTRFSSAALGAGDREECNRVFNTALRIYVTLSLIVLFATIVIASLSKYLVRNPTDAALFWKLVLILGMSFALLFPNRVYNGMLEANLRFDRAASIDLMSLVVRTVLVIAALLLGYKVVGLAVATLVAGVPAVIAYIYSLHSEMPFLRLDAKYWGWPTAKTLFSYSAFSFISQLAEVLRYRVDNVVVAAFVGAAAVTHYRVGGALAQSFFELMLAIGGVFPSVFSRLEGAKDFEGIKKTFFFATKVTICVSSFIGFGLIAWGKPFIARWMGPSYVDSYPVLVALVLGCVFTSSQGPSVGLLYGTSRHKFLALVNSIEGVINLALSIILVRMMGIVGVALGTLIPMTASKLIVQPFYVCRVSHIPYFEYLRRSGKTVFFVALSLVLPLLLTHRLSAPNYKALVLLAVLSFALYVPSLWFLEFDAKEKAVLKKALSPWHRGEAQIGVAPSSQSSDRY